MRDSSFDPGSDVYKIEGTDANGVEFELLIESDGDVLWNEIVVKREDDDPDGPADVRFYVLRNNTPDGSVFLSFADSLSGPLYTRSYRGCLFWHDVDHDGDLDLLQSGLAWDPRSHQADFMFTRIHLSDGHLVSSAGSHLLLTEGTAKLLASGWREALEEAAAALDKPVAPLPGGGIHVAHVTAADHDRDGYTDLILALAPGHVDVETPQFVVHATAYSQQVWLCWQRRDWGRGNPELSEVEFRYRVETSLFARIGEPVEGLLFHTATEVPETWLGIGHPLSRAELLGPAGWSGGAGDWDGDGDVDLAFPGEFYYVGVTLRGKIMLREATATYTAPSLDSRVIPGYRFIGDGQPADVAQPRYPSGVHVCADLLAEGKQQWLGSIFSGGTIAYAGAPEVILARVASGQFHLATDSIGIPGRFRGVLDAVDANGDGRLEVFHSGLDEGRNAGTRLYRHTLPANTRPLPPSGLLAQVKPMQVVFKWNEGSDAETGTRALRYAVTLRRQDGLWYLRPGATPDGKRLLPNLEGAVPATGYPLGWGPDNYFFGPELRFAEVQDVSSLPTLSNAPRVLVALVGAGRHLHIRIFERFGSLSRDVEESAMPDGQLKTDLKAFLTGPAVFFPRMNTLTPEQREWIITSARILTGHTSFEFVFEHLNHGTRLTLPDGTYRWSVQAIDSGGMGSVFAPEQMFIIGPDPGNPPPPPPPDTGERRTDFPYRSASLDLGDMDGDGDLDVLLAGKGENGSEAPTVVERNDGQHPTELSRHNFTAVFPNVPSLENGAVRWGDVDGDGDLDLALSGKSHGLPMTKVYRNTACVLGTPQSLGGGVENSALDWGDFDNDGDLDLIVTGYRDRQPRTRLYRNGGRENRWLGVLAEQATTLPDFGAGAAAWGDYDRDGDLDLLLCGDTQRYDQSTSPCFVPTHAHQSGDLFMCGPGGDRVPQPKTTLFRNDGMDSTGAWLFTPTFVTLPPVFSYTAMAARAEWCDLSGNGFPDLVLSGLTTVPSDPRFGRPTARVFRNEGRGPGLGEWRFVQGQELLTGSIDRAVQTMSCADWDNEGRPDVLLSGWVNGPGTVPAQIIPGQGNGGLFIYRARLLDTTSPEGAPLFAGGLAAFGHFDGDYKVDVAQSGRWGIQGTGGLGNTTTEGRLFLKHGRFQNLLPTVPTNLLATVSGTGTEVTLAWTASTDPTQPTLLTYNLHVERVDGQPGGMPGMASRVTGRRLISRPGNVGHHTSWTLRDLPAGEYRWSVQAIDASLAPSAFAHAAQTFTAALSVAPVINPLPPLFQWEVRNPGLPTVDLNAVASARSARLVVGRRGRIFLSRWTAPFAEVNSGVFTDLNDVIIGEEGATVVGEAGVIRTSSDGAVWSESPSGTTALLRTVIRGHTGWVAAGDGAIRHSTDRLAWTAGTMPGGTSVRDLAWANNRYVAVGEKAAAKIILTSTDGLVWSEVALSGLASPWGRIGAIAHDETRFVAVGGSTITSAGVPRHSDILTSPNGLTWTVSTTLNDNPLAGIIYGAGSWIAWREDRIVRSLDAAAWVEIHEGNENFGEYFRGVAIDDNHLTVIANAGVVYDAVTPVALQATSMVEAGWTRRAGVSYSERNYFYFTGIASLGTIVVAVGSNGLTFVSQDDGHIWQRSQSAVSTGYYTVMSANGVFLRTHRDGIEASNDGLVWDSVYSGNIGYTASIAFGNGRFVAPAQTGGFLSSVDGRIWTPVANSPAGGGEIAFGNGRFLCLGPWTGGDRIISASTSGTAWSEASRLQADRLCFARDRFFAIRSFGPVHSSLDGVAWQPVAGVPTNVVLERIQWHRDRFVATGPNGVLLTSTDLSTWTRIPIATTQNLVGAVSLSDGLLVAGQGQDLLFTPDTATPPPVAPVLNIAANPAPNVFRFNVSGNAGQTVMLERSADLSQWIAVETLILSGGREVLEVEAPAERPKDYFRLRWQP